MYNNFMMNNNRNSYVPQQFLKGRLVGSIEEVRSMPIDFDGSVSYFPDITNKKIYTKQIAADGSLQIQAYALEVVEEPQLPHYVTMEEFEKFKQEILANKADFS